MNKLTLTWDEFCKHMEESDVRIINPGSIYRPSSVAIRSGKGLDFGVAAVHREGDVLIIDMGHCLEEIS